MKPSFVLAVHAPSITCILGAVATVIAGAHWGFFVALLILAFVLSATLETK